MPVIDYLGVSYEHNVDHRKRELALADNDPSNYVDEAVALVSNGYVALQ